MQKQQGAALIIVLVLLSVSLVIGMSGMSAALVDERLAGNYSAAVLAQMNAERAASESMMNDILIGNGSGQGQEFWSDEPGKNLLKNNLQEIINKSVNNPRQHKGKIEKAMETGMAEARKFSNLWKTGSFGGDLLSMEHDETNYDNPEIGKIAEEYAEQFKDAQMTKQFRNFNQRLRNFTWAIPYIGIHYQGGKSQKIEPMLR